MFCSRLPCQRFCGSSPQKKGGGVSVTVSQLLHRSRRSYKHSEAVGRSYENYWSRLNTALEF